MVAKSKNSVNEYQQAKQQAARNEGREKIAYEK